MSYIERTLQININALSDWANNNGFKFSTTKTVCIHFCNRRLVCPDPLVTLKDSPIPVVKEFRFLGLLFDSRLSFIPHLRALKTRAQKALNLIKVVAARGWGADRLAKLTLYRALVRSKLDYGSMVYGSARPSYLKMIEPVQNQGLRLCLNAFRTTPIGSLHVEANELPLDLRRLQLAMQYAVKLYANPRNPAHDIVSRPQFEQEFANMPSTIPTFGIRMKPHVQAAGINTLLIAEQTVSNTPKWRWSIPNIDLSLTALPKGSTNPEQYKALFGELKDQQGGTYRFIYTDGSKQDEKASSAAVYQDRVHSQRIPDRASIFTAEIRALKLALWTINISTHTRFMILIDSLSVIQSIGNMLDDNPQIAQILDMYTAMPEKEVTLCWIPSHVGILGNERADQAAKEALLLPVTEQFVPYSDYRPVIKQYIKNLWREYWSFQTDNKLYQIGATINTNQPLQPTIREDTVIRRLRMGHTRLTHAYLFTGDNPPFCFVCNMRLTVKHIMLECVDFAQARSRHFNVNTFQDVFNNVEPSAIIDYLKDIQLFDRF